MNKITSNERPSGSPGSGTVRTADEPYEQRVARLRDRTADDGWKGPRSVRVAPETWTAAMSFVDAVVAETKDSHPFVSVGGDGTILLSWGWAPGPVLDITVKPDGSFDWELDGDDFEEGTADAKEMFGLFAQIRGGAR